MENERLAEKLNNPEEYARIWGKPDKNQKLVQLENKVTNLEQQLNQTQQQLEKEKESNSTRISPL